MLRTVTSKKLADEGYIYVSYGHPKYLKHAVSSVVSLRRYDSKRPVALLCDEKQKAILDEAGISHIFDYIFNIPEEHASIVGFKHNTYQYMLFEKNLYLDSDIVWCKNPDDLWKAFSPFDFTITGNMVADNFFGAAKNIGVIKDMMLRRRSRTLKRFGLTYLSRVQSGVMYAKDYSVTKKVCNLAGEMLRRKHETHFRSRKMEKGRNEESCEWSLAMAMSKLDIPVYPWLNGFNSIQLDYIGFLTEHDPDFQYVRCKFYCNPSTNSLRGLNNRFLRSILFMLYSLLPGRSDYMYVTPFCLHFGWYHQKQPFNSFSEAIWKSLTIGRKEQILASKNYLHNISPQSNG